MSSGSHIAVPEYQQIRCLMLVTAGDNAPLWGMKAQSILPVCSWTNRTVEKFHLNLMLKML